MFDPQNVPASSPPIGSDRQVSLNTGDRPATRAAASVLVVVPGENGHL
jgi:hypothetical protein